MVKRLTPKRARKPSSVKRGASVVKIPLSYSAAAATESEALSRALAGAGREAADKVVQALRR